ncbi:DUF4224 domain-containing protein [Denitromonas iodatirespirans]|uniref:DUF4224 domain-containing protein n=1 Tax=Denitromonas iodatirespirans TaxID=2795389 RepID=A0A944DB22_DENI1|nr:DUF4224 domain-containing protein [Denitromonas iodatirespirans]MBT0962052.1 DUF4224 domain-containing protein [Denitromonas iodatirespirans]
MEPLFLSKEEIAELTGFKLHSKQCGWLRQNGWIFEQNANRRPIVGRAYARQRLGFASDSAPTPSTARPNFDALR